MAEHRRHVTWSFAIIALAGFWSSASAAPINKLEGRQDGVLATAGLKPKSDETAKPAPIKTAHAQAAPASVLYLNDGDYFTGVLTESPTADAVRWQANGVVSPFEFPTAAVRAAFFPSNDPPAPAKADYCFELSDGDRLFGSLVSLGPEEIEIDAERVGRLRIKRSHVRRVVPWQGATSWEYSGPNNLGDWRHSPENDGWHEEAGHLLTEAPSASLRRQIKIPEQAIVEFAVSWNKKLDFMFVLADGSDKRSESEGIHLEVWDQTLVLVRESRDDADLATVCNLKEAKNRIHLQILIDQKAGTVAVHSLDGAKLGEITFDADKDVPLQWVFLRNHRGDVRLEQIVVSKWSGQPPAQVDVTRERIQKSDGSVVYGDVLSFEPESKRFVMKDGEDEKTVAAGDVSAVALVSDITPAPGAIRVGCHDGSRLSGSLAKVEAGKLYVRREGIEELVEFPLTNVRCLIGTPTLPANVQSQPSIGRLELDGVSSHGALVDGKSSDTTSCLVWRPRQSTTSSPLTPTISGRIVYRDPPPPVKLTPQQIQRQRELQQRQAQRPGVLGAMINAFSGPPANAPTPRMSGYPHAIYLRAGDRIPCIVSRIDQQGVHFSSSVVQSGMVPHEQIKAVELISNTAGPILAEAKRTRLLTLPRMQRNNPPTHLVASSSGDYLRARLQSMDGQTLVAETRLESKRLARGRVATIIWLHPTKDEEPPADEDKPQSPLQIQAVRADGVRLTFVPHEFANSSLIGNSDLLGACQVDVKSVDRILIGDAIEETSDETIYDAWKLSDAVEPKFVQDDASGGAAAAGLSSSLIGKPAPEIKLATLDGGQFKLSDEQGQIVVLDFWASWCPHCMQGMPELINVTDEFKDKRVKYVAVNLQEDRATITGALERQQLGPLVVLDIDGAAAERYEVSALPQVVIIDSDGIVARMFVGVDLNFAEQMRQALKALVDASAAPPAGDASGQ
jgi:thiol-disulfide isomerase/thioredoxin